MLYRARATCSLQRLPVITVMKAGDYVLWKRFLSFLGNYRLTDATGATVMRFVGHLRVALRFDAVDAKGNVLFRGQGRLQDTRNRVTFTQDGQTYGSMRAEWGGRLRRESPQKRRCVIEASAGESLQTDGDCATVWSLLRQEVLVARVEQRGRRWNVKLIDDANADFVLTVVVAIVHQTLGDERSLD
jgi:hypothetical protein